MTNIKARSVIAFKWEFVGSLIVKGGGFVLSIILARLLSPEEFGVIGMAMVFVGISQALVDVGFSSAIVNVKKITQTQLSTIFYINLILSTLLFVIFFFSAQYIAVFYKVELVESVTKWMSLLFVINGLGQVQLSLLIRSMSFDKITKISITSLLLSGTLAIISSYLGAGIWALVIQQIMLAFCSNVLFWIYSNWKPSLEFRLKEISELFRYGINLFGATVLNASFMRFDSLIIGKVFSANVLGLYSRSLDFQKMIEQLSTNGMNVLFPAFSQMQDKPDELANAFLKIFGIVSVTGTLLSGLLWLIAKPLFILLLGMDWVEASDYFRILSLSSFGIPLSIVMVQTIKAMGKSKLFLKLDILKKLVTLPMYITAFYFSIDIFLWFLFIAKIINLNINIKYMFQILNVSKKQIYRPMVRDVIFAGVLAFSISLLPTFDNIILQIIIPTSLFLLISLAVIWSTNREFLYTVKGIIYK